MTAGAKITGRVETTDGAPLPGVFLRANPIDGPVHGWGQRNHVNASAFSDDTGRFELVGLADTPYKLAVEGPRVRVGGDGRHCAASAPGPA